MKGKSILFVGCGDLGERSGALFAAAGWQVAALRRDPGRLPADFAGIAGDYTKAGSLNFIAGLQPDYVVATCNPADRSVEGYRRGFALAACNLLAGLGGHRPKSILWVSSTRVYAECDGGWVDEASALNGEDPRALEMIAAERTLLDSGQSSCVVRFAGIYGYPGGRLLARIRRGEISPALPLRYTNRIHRDDCAGLIFHLIQLARSGAKLAPVYNGVDDLPAARREVELWLAAQMGVEARSPATVDSTSGSADQTLLSGHKRASNHLLRATGYEFRYPDYRSGYLAVLRAEAAS